MPLFYREFGVPSESSPSLIFLHGFLGNGLDWQLTAETLSQHHHCVLLDLPGHGQSVACEVNDFPAMREMLCSWLRKLAHPFILIGYSLGGRVAMDLTAHALMSNQKALIVEGGHFGLQSFKERQDRALNDATWATRFDSEPLIDVLKDWYRQGVFSSASDVIKSRWIVQRAENNGYTLSNMLKATSLSQQDFLLPLLTAKAETLPMLYLCGEHDAKFRALAAQSPFQMGVIAKAGHNAHAEQPLAVSKCIASFVKQIG